MTPAQLEKRYETLIKRELLIKQEKKEFIELIKDMCHHPDKHQYTTYEDHDDGYGTWWKTYYTQCKICGRRKQVY